MQRRKLRWFVGVGVAAVLGLSWASARRFADSDAPMTPVSQSATQTVLARTDGPFSLENGPVHVPLGAVHTRTGAGPPSLAAQLERVQPEQHVLLGLRDLHAAQPPNIVVQMSLDPTNSELLRQVFYAAR